MKQQVVLGLEGSHQGHLLLVIEVIHLLVPRLSMMA